MAHTSLESVPNSKQWICIYPLFIDKNRSTAEGRRISRNNAVDNPTSQEIFDILSHSGFNCLLESKIHPRCSGDHSYQGRVRVQFKNDDGTPINPNFSKRGSLITYVAEMIPKLKTRQSLQNSQQATSINTGNEKQKKKKR